jgi:hypothetical protein
VSHTGTLCVMPYVDRAPERHQCEPPGRDVPTEHDKPRRGDTWECPDCHRLYYCSGWMWIIPAHSSPVWHRVPRSRWLSAQWVRRFYATFVSAGR